jgi:hypothetical protein
VEFPMLTSSWKIENTPTLSTASGLKLILAIRSTTSPGSVMVTVTERPVTVTQASVVNVCEVVIEAVAM